jgi:hypothetical protein
VRWALDVDPIELFQPAAPSAALSLALRLVTAVDIHPKSPAIHPLPA